MGQQRNPVLSYAALGQAVLGAACLLPQALVSTSNNPVFVPASATSGAALVGLALCGMGLLTGVAALIRREGTRAILACLAAPAAAYALLSLWSIGQERRDRQWGASGRIEAFSVLPHHKIVVAGRGMARLEEDGDADDSFVQWSAASAVAAMARLSTGPILYGDVYDEVSAARFIGRMSGDGPIDTSFYVSHNVCPKLHRIAPLAGGGALLQCSAMDDDVLDSFLVCLDKAGHVVDDFWKHAPKKHITAIATRPEGGFALAVSHRVVEAYKANGWMLWDYAAGSGVSLAVTPAAGGGYYTCGGWASACVRLTADGAVDSSFAPDAALAAAGLHERIGALIQAPNGDLILAGNGRLIRLHSDGGLDEAFHQPHIKGFPDYDELQMQGDRILLLSEGGKLIRFNGDGTPDPTFAVPDL
jgi:hypothetical protein